MVTVWFLRSIDVKEYSPVKTDWVGRESIEQNWASGFRLVGRCLGASGRDELECGVLPVAASYGRRVCIKCGRSGFV